MIENLTKKFKLWLASKTEHCKSVSPLFSLQRERKLSLIETFRLRLHLFTCSACLNYVTNLNFMHDVFQAQRNQPETDQFQIKLSSDAKERLKKAIASNK